MALVEGFPLAKRDRKDAEVIIGEDWEGAGDNVEQALRESRSAGGFVRLRGSPIARKIIVFNLTALVLLVAGVLFVNPFRDSLVAQLERSLKSEAKLVANVFEVQVPSEGPVDLTSGEGIDPVRTLDVLDLSHGVSIKIFDADERLVALSQIEPSDTDEEALTDEGWSAGLMRFFGKLTDGLQGSEDATGASAEARAQDLVKRALGGTAQSAIVDSPNGSTFLVSVPVKRGDEVVAAVLLATPDGIIDALSSKERDKVLQLFLIAAFVSVGLSLLLANTIANPLADLALAAELGRDRNARKMSPSRVRIPDLTARPDEIGRLSGAMRGMVRALYDRIDANEQFAADVSHEIKNPLASLRSAVGTLRVARNDEQREKLFDVIDHDVRRLDRLVSDISNASRLDSELVKEEEETFDLLKMLGHLVEFHGVEARDKGVDFISDMPKEPLVITGLEGRLAQVFVNLITNATSFCEEGDAVRIWVRRRANRVLVVVEDTGPGIPDQALHKVFNRFYSERPVDQFGDHSGLGLAISKQIVEAHGGVIWAENIRPTDADVTSDPLGARFVVGLPI